MIFSVSLQATYIKSNGTVSDTETGLMWQDDYSDNDGKIKQTNWYNAVSYCNDLDALGYDDWRLPNVNELALIVDDTKGTEPYHIPRNVRFIIYLILNYFDLHSFHGFLYRQHLPMVLEMHGVSVFLMGVQCPRNR
ncbi:DUF1566 domain-containing protein [Campylobacterota bacterium]